MFRNTPEQVIMDLESDLDRLPLVAALSMRLYNARIGFLT